MGVTASITDQKALFDDLRRQLDDIPKSVENQAEDESGEESEIDEVHPPTKDIVSLGRLFEKANQTYATWYRSMALKERTLFCELTDFEDSLEAAFRTGLTPLILDTSGDDKVCTFFSYQPDVILLDAKAMIIAASAGNSHKNRNKTKSTKGNTNTSKNTASELSSLSIEEKLMVLDTARKALVTAMKFGKLLVIRLGTSAPDFLHVFSDQALGIDTTRAGSAYFPLEVFYQAGSLLHDADAFASADDASRRVTQASAKLSMVASSSTGEIATTERVEKAPMKAPTWAERLYREEDMKPHKNFALCRYCYCVYW